MFFLAKIELRNVFLAKIELRNVFLAKTDNQHVFNSLRVCATFPHDKHDVLMIMWKGNLYISGQNNVQ